MCRDANAYTLASLQMYNSPTWIQVGLSQTCRDANAYAFASLQMYRSLSNVFGKVLHTYKGGSGVQYFSDGLSRRKTMRKEPPWGASVG